MKNATTSVMVFGIYMLVLGLVLLIMPNTLLELFAMSKTDEVWIRVVGMLVFILSGYYIQAARHRLVPFYQATVYGRPLVILFFTLFVLLDMTQPMLILFGLIDLLGALWTGWALRTERMG